jgi:hypothetical protein
LPVPEVAEQRWGEVDDPGVVEVGESFGAGELGLVDQSEPAAFVAFVALGGEHLGQERFVRQPLLSCCGGHFAGVGADGGQLQRLGRRIDRDVGGWLGEPGHRHGRGHAVAPVSSWS